MSIKQIVISQYRNIVNEAADKMANPFMPNEGWIGTVRKALNMSGAQLARRMGVTRARIFKSEKAELSGAVTLKTMQRTAEAMGCRFVYAIIPDQKIEKIIEDQARKKATELVKRTNIQMALESQTLSNEKIKFEIDRLTQEMVKVMPSDFWDNDKTGSDDDGLS